MWNHRSFSGLDPPRVLVKSSFQMSTFSLLVSMVSHKSLIPIIPLNHIKSHKSSLAEFHIFHDFSWLFSGRETGFLRQVASLQARRRLKLLEIASEDDSDMSGRLRWTRHRELKHQSMGISGSNRWRYVSTIFQAIFCGDIPLHRPEK